jgi:hypothetical protein
MKKRIWLLMLVFSAACAMFGCASTLATGVPEGSVLLGVYQGTFNGAYNEGTVEFKLYRSPEGSRSFYGHFDEGGSFLNLTGEMKENDLQGQILLPLEGTISGNLSDDLQSLSGTYKFTVAPFDHGTWQASKQ